MIEQFSKWLELVPLLNHNNEGATYTFFDRVFIRFGILVEVFTNQLENFVVGSKNYVRKHRWIITLLHKTILRQRG
jgi:hypothetical protein